MSDPELSESSEMKKLGQTKSGRSSPSEQGVSAGNVQGSQTITGANLDAAVGLQPQVIEQSGAHLEISRTMSSGPIPPPSTLRDFGEISSDFPDRIVKMAEGEQAHRHEMEKDASALQKRGQIFALTITLVFGAGAVSLALSGQSVVAGIMVGMPLVSIVTMFISGRITKSKRLAQPEQSED